MATSVEILPRLRDIESDRCFDNNRVAHGLPTTHPESESFPDREPPQITTGTTEENDIANGYLDLSVNTNLLGNILDHGTVPTRGIIRSEAIVQHLSSIKRLSHQFQFISR